MASASEEIDVIIRTAEAWKGQKLVELREVIRQTDASIVETVKWKKPSKPEGVAVWEHNGILCHADLLKKTVRITFHKGVQIKDPGELFNTRLDSRAVRAIDFGPEDTLDKAGLQSLVAAAISLNATKAGK